MKGSFTGRARAITGKPLSGRDDGATTAPNDRDNPDLQSSAPPAENQSLTGRLKAAWRHAVRTVLLSNAPLKTRLFAAMVALVVATGAGLGFAAYNNLEDALLKSETGRLESDVRAMAMYLDASVRDMREDIVALRGASAVEGIVRASEAGGPIGSKGVDPTTGIRLDDWRRRLADQMVATLKAKNDYLQMRMIGVADGGREIVRVERSQAGGDVRVVPDAKLQQKGDTSYFRGTVDLPAGSVYISPLNLNREHGVVQIPRTPVLRSATPVYDDAGHLFGILVINVAMQPTLNHLRTQARDRGQIYMVNADGDFLVHPDHSREFGFEFGLPHRVQDEMPRLPPLVQPGESLSRIVRDPGHSGVGVAEATVRLAGGPAVTVFELLAAAGSRRAARIASHVGDLDELLPASSSPHSPRSSSPAH